MELERTQLLAASKTASLVGNGLLEQKPMLLVDIYDFFTNTASALRSLYLPDDTSDVASPRWLLSFLIKALQVHHSAG